MERVQELVDKSLKGGTIAQLSVLRSIMPPLDGVAISSPWQHHPITYRTAEMRTLAQWVLAGASGAVVGLPGVGRSNLLGFLCHRSDALRGYIDPQRLTVILVPVDLRDLPSNTLTDLYRMILRSFYETRSRFRSEMQTVATQIYRENRTVTDAFLTQSALRELLLHFQESRTRVVLVIDGVDAFCPQLTPEMVQVLGALRDAFRDTLSYIVGVRQSLAYLEELELTDDLKRLLTTHLCYLGPLNEDDAFNFIERRTAVSEQPPSDAEVAEMLSLSGGYPMLLKVICRWWLLTPIRPPLTEWRAILFEMPAIQQPLQSIWAGLTQEEQMVLSESMRGLLSGVDGQSRVLQRAPTVLQELATKGICRCQCERWQPFSTLFIDYIAQVGGMSRGRIWLEPSSHMLYHGRQPLDNLTPKEHDIMQFLIKCPSTRQSYTAIISAVWSDDENYNGVSNDSLFQVIKGLRRKIEPNPNEPVYLVNWRGKPEGGYLFYPEGRPA